MGLFLLCPMSAVADIDDGEMWDPALHAGRRPRGEDWIPIRRDHQGRLDDWRVPNVGCVVMSKLGCRGAFMVLFVSIFAWALVVAVVAIVMTP